MATLRSRAGRSLTRLPAIMMSPDVAHSSPAIMRNIVVLPQPDGPSRHITSPLPTVEIGLVDRDEAAAEALRRLFRA